MLTQSAMSEEDYWRELQLEMLRRYDARKAVST
jgi:hypothetical protein